MGRRIATMSTQRVGVCLFGLMALSLPLLAGCETGVQAERQRLRLLNNHRKHVDVNMGCSGYHFGSRDEHQAHLPSIHACAQCHQTDRSVPPTEPELAKHIQSATEIPWIRLNRLPGHVFFSHVAHVRLGKIECGECLSGCGIRVRVVNGRAVKIEGNRACPINEGGNRPQGSGRDTNALSSRSHRPTATM